MKISPINKIITPKTTGYTAAAGLCLTAMSGFSKNKTFRKSHKFLAFSTAIITAIHIAQIEYYHLKYKQNKYL